LSSGYFLSGQFFESGPLKQFAERPEYGLSLSAGLQQRGQVLNHAQKPFLSGPGTSRGQDMTVHVARRTDRQCPHLPSD
jgi:hypothetical protein